LKYLLVKSVNNIFISIKKARAKVNNSLRKIQLHITLHISIIEN